MPWVRINSLSFVNTGAMFVLFLLDMASPGYGSFLLIPDLRPQITTLTADIREDLKNLTRSKSSPTTAKKSLKPDKLNNCRTLLDSYKTGAKCHFDPTNYSDTYLQKSNIKK